MKSKSLKGKRSRKQLRRWSALKNSIKGLLRPEISIRKKEGTVLERNQTSKGLISTGVSLFYMLGVKNRY